MNKALVYLAAIALLVSLSMSACSVLTPGKSTAAPSISGGGLATELFRNSAPSLQPTSLGSGASQDVPICQASETCQAFDAEQIPLDCVKKIPYTNVLVPPGTKFEVVDKSGDFTCIDTGLVVNGKEVLTCHGKQLYSFELSLTNASCGASPLATGTGKCQDGYGYDVAQKCCTAIPSGTDGSITVRVNLGACPVPNP